MRTKRHAWSGESSPHPFIPRIPLAFSLLLPLLIALLLFLLLGTAPSAVVEFFLIHLTLVILSPRMGRVGKSVAPGRLYKEDGYTEEGLLLEGRLKVEVLQGSDC